MNDDLMRDLYRWESGEITRAELSARHPRSDGLLRARDRLNELAGSPIPTPERAWSRVRLSLAARPVARSFWRLAPAAALAGIALIASSGAVAAAAAPERTAEVIDHVLHVVGHHPSAGAHPPLQDPAQPSHAAAPTPDPGPSHAPAPSHHSDPSHAPDATHDPERSHTPDATHDPDRSHVPANSPTPTPSHTPGATQGP